MKNRILVVDDQPDITLALKLDIEDNGFKVNTSNDPMQVI
jgi:DNA-binding response OmpR family regulator